MRLVENRSQFDSALDIIFGMDRVALVQKFIHGHDYRVVVLDERVISAYQRIPLNIVGDGTATVQELAEAKQEQFQAMGRDTKIPMHDPRIGEVLARQWLTFQSVPQAGQTVYLLDNANLSTGGDSVDVTAVIHPRLARMCTDLTRDMGLRLCGVDLMLAGDIANGDAAYWIIEINASPALTIMQRADRSREKLLKTCIWKC